jgi:hypothetical protein
MAELFWCGGQYYFEADILCDVVILAKGEDAIRENTVELVIKESLSQRGIKADIDVA